MSLLVIYIFPLEKGYWKSLPNPKLGYFTFYHWDVRVLYIFRLLVPSQIYDQPHSVLSWQCLYQSELAREAEAIKATKKRFILRNWLMKSWDVTSLKFTGQDCRLETQAGKIMYILGAEFPFPQKPQVLLLWPSTNWMRLIHSVEGTLL